MSEQQCRYCKVSLAVAHHAAGCPTYSSKPEWAKAQWELDFGRGYADEYIHWRTLLYSGNQYFSSGYTEGRDRLEEEIEAANEWNYSYHRDEY